MALYLTGHVKSLISLEPGGYVSLWGKMGSVPREFIDITNNMKKPLQIIQIDSDLPERIEWRLEEVRPGFVYRLEVGDKSEEGGDYTGHLYLRTDHPGKSVLTVIVNGRIETQGE